ncbi:DUF1707 SHOCT-like domain-containing protein [Streptomyces litchfieldiae]|uniref:DUF1707 domain-containing protein n=1 Tax=Streptomyces litchfieldiae TaxID=3075543 RepID=A0ABU2N1V8_9ACTN|nr:DUF1707 domain-containing protein [Streptomyces sp. DSM 44938]MDT0347279.1 DUF1707 domain-containing protein [Streptomyces sp. DSM 44938]
MTSQPRPRAELRASHEDREAVAEVLREAAGEGRLDIDELEERLERALTAKTYGDLEPLTADLPVRPAALPGPPLPPANPGPPSVVKGGLHGGERVGRWDVPPKIVARGGLGGVKLDYTRAHCPWPETEVEVHGDMAGVTIIVPIGWRVDTTGCDPGIGGLKNKTTGDHKPGTPLLRVTGNGGMAGVTVRHPNRWERRRLRDNPA